MYVSALYLAVPAVPGCTRLYLALALEYTIRSPLNGDSSLESEARKEIIHIMGGNAGISITIYVLHFYFFHCVSILTPKVPVLKLCITDETYKLGLPPTSRLTPTHALPFHRRWHGPRVIKFGPARNIWPHLQYISHQPSALVSQTKLTSIDDPRHSLVVW